MGRSLGGHDRGGLFSLPAVQSYVMFLRMPPRKKPKISLAFLRLRLFLSFDSPIHRFTPPTPCIRESRESVNRVKY